MNRPGFFILTLLLGGALTGCATVGSSSHPSSQNLPADQAHGSAQGPPLVAIEVYAVPVALNWDSDPQPDGVELEVYFFASKLPLAQPVNRGILDIVAYDGRPDKQPLAARPPLHRWRLTPAILTGRAHRGMVGVGYGLALDWGNDVPQQDYVTITVEYRSSPDAAPIRAAPVSIPVERGVAHTTGVSPHTTGVVHD